MKSIKQLGMSVLCMGMISLLAVATMVVMSAIAPSTVSAAIGQTVPVSTYEVSNTTSVLARPFCKFGMQFISTTISRPSNLAGMGGIATVQVLERDGKPMACTEHSR